jgi:hypothetical protein
MYSKAKTRYRGFSAGKLNFQRLNCKKRAKTRLSIKT